MDVEERSSFIINWRLKFVGKGYSWKSSKKHLPELYPGNCNQSTSKYNHIMGKNPLKFQFMVYTTSLYKNTRLFTSYSEE